MAKERRLAAIMFTDVVGYSALTHRDEERSLELLNEHRRLVEPLFVEYDGQVIKTTGDGFHVEFPSAVQAVRCALDVQTRMRERNRTSAADDELQIRIGVHLGDVIFQEGDVYGDGVNVAARIEPFAEPGGVCISRTVYEHVRNKLDASFEELGTRALKNIDEPIAIYKVGIPDPQADPISSTSTSEPPRLAVLPLVNNSPDPEDEYFTDGMTEELIYTLSKVRGLRVIAQTSVMQYKGTEKNVSTIGRELNVGTVLEGSVRKSGNRLRITAQLIEAKSEEHLWAGRYDRDLEDVFAIQSEIAEQVAEELEVTLVGEERVAVERQSTENLEAYQLYLKGQFFLNKLKPESAEQAVNAFQRALEVDPKYAEVHVGLSAAYQFLIDVGFLSPDEHYSHVKDAIRTALSIDETNSNARVALARDRLLDEWDWAGSERELQRAIDLDPKNSNAHIRYFMLLKAQYRYREAKAAIDRALDLDPLSLLNNNLLGVYYYCQRQYDQAIAQWKRTVELHPDSFVHVNLWNAYLRSSQPEEAASAFMAFAERWSEEDDDVIDELRAAYEEQGTSGLLQTWVDHHGQSGGCSIPPIPTMAATFFIELGDYDRAIDCLNEDYRRRSQNLLAVLNYPEFEALSEDSRFLRLLKEMRVRQFWR